ncbi:ribonuclease FAU-1 family protein [Thermaerobacter litoralis]
MGGAAGEAPEPGSRQPAPGRAPGPPGQPGGPARSVRPVRVEAWLASGRLKATWEGTLLEGPGWWAVAAVWSRGPVAAGPLTFAPGDRLLEVYFAGRWYNVFRVAGPGAGGSGGGLAAPPRPPGRPAGAGGAVPYRLKGYYLNLSTPARLVREGGEGGGPARLVYVDGVLDAVVLPGGRWQWLDRDEFRRLVAPGRRPAEAGGADPAPGGRPGPEPAPPAGGAAGTAGPGGSPRGPGQGDRRVPPLPKAAAWREAAQQLARELAAGAGPFLAGLVPWDVLERALPWEPDALEAAMAPASGPPEPQGTPGRHRPRAGPGGRMMGGDGGGDEPDGPPRASTP